MGSAARLDAASGLHDDGECIAERCQAVLHVEQATGQDGLEGSKCIGAVGA